MTAAIGRLALVEGDATLVMSNWQLQHLTQMELFQLLGESLNPELTGQPRGDAGDPPRLAALPVHGRAGASPRRCRSARLGRRQRCLREPAGLDRAGHASREVRRREQPVDVDLPDDLAAKMGNGWTVGLEDTFGEFQLKTWLDQQPAAAGGPKASDAAAGWGGDRVALLDGPNGAWAIALETAWDTAQDATEFGQAAAPIVTKPRTATVTPGRRWQDRDRPARVGRRDAGRACRPRSASRS